MAERMSDAWVRGTRIETNLSAFGAGFFGLGAGLLVGGRVPVLAWGLLVAGLFVHGAAMVALHNRFRNMSAGWWWLRGAYWACWAVLVAVVAYLVWLAAS